MQASLPLGAIDHEVREMFKSLNKERQVVTQMVKEEIVLLMCWGAKIAGMTYMCPNTKQRHSCTNPGHMRSSFLDDNDDLNIKRIHWLFNELPWSTHQDILMERKSHMDLVVERVQNHLNVVWAPMVEGRGPKRKNCIQHIYLRLLNEKRCTIIKGAERKPYIRTPKSFVLANRDPNYRKGKVLFCWKSTTQGERSVIYETNYRRQYLLYIG